MATSEDVQAFFRTHNYHPPQFDVPEPGSPAFAAYFDHTLLKPEATQDQIDALCAEARRYGFKSVCVRLPWVERCKQSLSGSGVLVACVVGFHEGTFKTAQKVIEAQQAVAQGAAELDLVMNYPSLIAGDHVSVQADIEAVRNACPAPTVLKVIIETSQLSAEQIAQACDLVTAAKADFIKTSTGFNGRGATVEDVQMMKRGVGGRAKVKASGGVRTVQDAVHVIQAGAERIGASAGVAIMEEARTRVAQPQAAGEAGAY